MLEKNLQAIAIKNPELAKRIMVHTQQGVEFTTCANGEYNISYNGNIIHDALDPQFEAKMIFGDDDNTPNALKAIFGLGLGYLFKRAYISSNGNIIVYEPILDILRATLEVVDFSNEFSDPRVFITDELEDLVMPFANYLIESVNILSLDSYINMLSEQFELLKFQLNRYFLDQSTNINKSKEIASSFASNLPYVIKEPSVDVLESKFEGKAALVVSAGPSLEKTIKSIKDNRDKFVIISVGQAVRALIAEDITPDLVIMIDRLPFLHQIDCFENKKDFLNLVLQPSCSTELFQEEAHTRFIYMPSSNFMTEWMRDRVDFKSYPQGGTVSVCAFNLAVLLGASPIILVGQDLAYSGDKVYAANTIYDSVRVNLESDESVKATIKKSETFDSDQKVDALLESNLHGYEKTLIVKGQNGEDLYTSNSYATFISLFKDLAIETHNKYPNRLLINCSEGGALIEGFEHKNIDEVIPSLNPIKENVLQLLHDEYTRSIADEAKIESLKLLFIALIKDLKKLKEDSEKTKKLTRTLKKELKYSKALTNKLLASVPKLQALDQKLKDYNKGHRVSFIYPFIQKELFEYNKVKDKVPSGKLEMLQFFVDSLDKYADAMIVGVDRTLVALKNSEGL